MSHKGDVTGGPPSGWAPSSRATGSPVPSRRACCIWHAGLLKGRAPRAHEPEGVSFRAARGGGAAGGQPEDTAAWLNGGIRGGGEGGGTGILTSQRPRRRQTCTGNASSVGHPGTTDAWGQPSRKASEGRWVGSEGAVQTPAPVSPQARETSKSCSPCPPRGSSDRNFSF